jgi:hypothetical protein
MKRHLYSGTWLSTKKELNHPQLAQLFGTINLMNGPSNQFLLKQYIITLLSPRPIFADVNPRPFGQGFSLRETQQIYESLRELLKQANAITNGELISAFANLDEHGTHQLHWFIFSYWPQIVELLDK